MPSVVLVVIAVLALVLVLSLVRRTRRAPYAERPSFGADVRAARAAKAAADQAIIARQGGQGMNQGGVGGGMGP